jgi:hypothetical protein
MAKPHLSRHQATDPIIASPHDVDALHICNWKNSTATLLVCAGAVAVIVPVSILSLLLFLMGA